jgi:hypothetical protein
MEGNLHTAAAMKATKKDRFWERWEDCPKNSDPGWREAKMPDDEWIKRLDDGRNVKFSYQELPRDGAFITAQLEANEVVYSVVLTEVRKPLGREDVERHFKGELSKK